MAQQEGQPFGSHVPRIVPVADYDADLFAGIHHGQARARRAAIAQAVELEPGEWSFPQSAAGGLERLRDERESLGLLILEGLLWRETAMGTGAGIEVLGPGDLLRPWVRPVPESEILAEPSWTVLERSSVAILDGRFARAMAPWPAVSAALMDRLILRSRWLAFHLAICHVRALPLRILLAMWHFGDRWGRMSPEGVIVPVRLPHRMLAQLVGARRPSVTTSLSALRADGRLVERADGSWLLPGGPPAELRVVYEQATTQAPLDEQIAR